MLNIIYQRFYFILLSTIIVLFDQLAKYFISIYSTSLINKDFIIFTLDFVKNFGAAFNLLSGSRIFLSIISIIITLLLVYFILYKRIIHYLDLLGYSFILGGTLGNGIDRIFKGYVIDFINLNFIDFPVFNIADISINIGFLIVIYGFIKYNK